MASTRSQEKFQLKTNAKMPLLATWRWGDIGKLVVIVLNVLFLSALLLQQFNFIDIFSPSYLEEGFCISNRDDSPLIQSHALSFYADAALALFMGYLVYKGPKYGLTEEALRPMSKNAVSLFGHGCGHLLLGLSTMFGKGASEMFENLTPVQQLAIFILFTPVWYGFMRDKSRSFTTAMTYAMGHNALQIFVLPSKFFFTHVLLAVLVNSAIRWLRKPQTEKSVYYDLEACLVDVPIMLAAFVEGCTCDSFLSHFGGHVWFDMVVPVMFTVYYIILTRNGKLFKTNGKAKAA
eukprot:m.12820 g.12820  ORF g.12820 m.12820 type:complete len:292 (-) comp4735_c0_seq1:114-989(-)